MRLKTEPVKLKGQRKLTPRLLLEEFSLLYYIGKWCGLSSHDYQEFRKYKRLKRSQGGDCYVVISMIMIFINFNLMVVVFENSTYVDEKNFLTVVIGFVLTYFSLLTYLVDRIAALLKHNQLIEIFDNLQDLETDFEELGLTVTNSFIKYRIMLALLSSAILECLIFVFTFTLLVDRSSWTAWLWTFTGIPTYANTLDKIWYISIIMVIKKRFAMINREFNRLSDNLQCKKKKKASVFVLSSLKRITIQNPTKAKVYPQQFRLSNNIGPALTTQEQQYKAITALESAVSNSDISSSSSISFEILEDTFTKLCQLHDGLCGVANQVNELWAIPNLVLMGYGFFIITAQLYFLYCSNAEQVIPSLFRPASNLGILAINLFYVANKCVTILCVNWQTILEAKKTGICMHRYAVAADRNEVYEMVNHLSLKLFNHVVTFNACGFFSLDMATLFAFCGGITTYLIILIQFNIEEQQVKSSYDGKTQSSLLVNGSTDTVLQTNLTSILNQSYYNNISWEGFLSDANYFG